VPAVAEKLEPGKMPKSSWESQAGGVMLFAPFIDQLNLPKVVEEAGLPGTKSIPALSYFLSFLALKLIRGPASATVRPPCFSTATRRAPDPVARGASPRACSPAQKSLQFRGQATDKGSNRGGRPRRWPLPAKRNQEMSGIHSIDLKGFVTHTVRGVFHTMLSMQLEPEDPPSRRGLASGGTIVGTVGFAGRVMGTVSICVSLDFAREMTAAILGVALAAVGGEEEVNDVVGEVCNMVGGDLKSRLCDAGMHCSLTIPTIAFGQNFKIESKGWERHEEFEFRNSHHSALVELCIRSDR
jgi:chemotaxis protein CheX